MCSLFERQRRRIQMESEKERREEKKINRENKSKSESRWQVTQSCSTSLSNLFSRYVLRRRETLVFLSLMERYFTQTHNDDDDDSATQHYKRNKNYIQRNDSAIVMDSIRSSSSSCYALCLRQAKLFYVYEVAYRTASVTSSHTTLSKETNRNYNSYRKRIRCTYMKQKEN